MTVHADAIATLTGWVGPSPSQTALAHCYLGWLEAHPDACARTCAPGHLTASAMVFGADLTHVALVLHGRVHAWLQPGGHLEAADASLADAARREIREELGLEVALDPVPVTLDCHLIACRGYRRPTRHFDVRFVARADAEATLACSDESHAVAWWPVAELPGVYPEVRELVELGLARLAG